MAADATFEQFIKDCNALLSKGKFTEVAELCDRQLKKDESSAVWRLKGIALQEIGKNTEAITCFENALRLGKNDADNYYAYGILMLNSREYESALFLFGIANAFKPNADTLFIIGITDLMLEKEEDAALALRQAVAIDKERTTSLAREFFDKYYKNNKGIPDKDKMALKAQIERLTRSL